MKDKGLKDKGQTPPVLKRLVRWVERAIIVALIGSMSLLLLLATVELVYTIYTALIDQGSDKLVINMDNLLNVFGVFLLVLIGIELLDTIKVYFKENVVHVEVVLLVALIAIARKVIVLDFDEYSGIEILSIAAVIMALSAGYYLIKKTGGTAFLRKRKEEVEDVVEEEEPLLEDTDQTKKRKIIKRRLIETPVETPKEPDDSEPDAKG